MNYIFINNNNYFSLIKIDINHYYYYYYFEIMNQAFLKFWIITELIAVNVCDIMEQAIDWRMHSKRDIMFYDKWGMIYVNRPIVQTQTGHENCLQLNTTRGDILK